MAEPLLMHECRGTKTRKEIVGDIHQTWIFCDTCHQWWVAMYINMRSLGKIKGAMKRSEGDTQNGRKATQETKKPTDI